MTNSYKCTICDEEFPTQVSRENHFRGNCQPHMNLTDLEANIIRVVRTDGKFRCPLCLKSYQYSNKLAFHWKTCKSKTHNEMATDDDFLTMHLKYDGNYNLAVCSDCGHGLPLEWISKHFKDVHKFAFTDERVEWLDTWMEDNQVKTLEECRIWKEDMHLVNGPIIDIPVKTGHGCPDCVFSQERARNITAHLVNVHGRRDNPATIPCSIQRIFVSNLHGWWRVNTATEDEFPMDEGLIALRHFNTEFDRLERQNRQSDIVVVPADQRLRSTWMWKSDWDVLLEGMEWQAVKALTKKPEPRESEYKVITAVKLYLSAVGAHLRKTGLFLRHEMLAGVNDNDYGKTFHALQEQSTVDNYAEMAGLFLIFCIRASHDEELRWSWEHPFTPNQQECLRRLERLVNALDDEPVTTDVWNPVIHKTLMSFVNCIETKRMVAEAEWPLYRFLIAISINGEGDGFGDPAKVPHIVKKLVYCIRVNVFEQARQLVEDDMDYDANNVLDKPDLDSNGGLFGLKKYVIDDGQTPFNAIRYISNVAGNLAASEPKSGFVDWNINPEYPDRYDVLLVKNKSFRFSRFISFIDTLLVNTNRLLYLEVLNGIRLPQTDLDSYEPAEDYNNRTNHYSAFTEPRNVFESHKKDIGNSWLSDRRKRNTMVRQVTEEGVQWKRSGAMAWLDQCLQYLQFLFVLLQVTWGGPARLAEMSSLRITNGQEERRNMYFDGNWLMFLFRYNKVRSITGKDRNIPRFPPPVVIKQLIDYLTLVRPQVSFFLKHFNLPGKDDIDEFLFVDHKVGRWTEKTMYRRFDEVTNRFGIGMITSSIYRQAAQLIMDKLVKFRWELPNEDNVLDESFGHSAEQAVQSYAIEIQGGDLVRKDDKAHFKAGAFKWHQIVIPNASRRGPLPKRGRDDEVDSNQLDDTLPVTRNPRISYAALSNILPPIQQDVSETIARHFLPSLHATVNPDVQLQPATLLALRRHFGNQQARFKSPSQAKAVQLVLNRKTDLFVILPTGGGKSLMFELLPILEPDGCSVLILPFVALMTEMRQRLRKAMPMAKASQWHSGRRSEDGLPHLLLVSIEEAVTPEFQAFIQQANVHQKVRRWIIDEFHVLVTQCEFRPVFPRLVTTIRLISIPLVCLSATIPDTYVDRIRLTLASSETTVVRCSTDRPNLRYQIHRLSRNTGEELDMQVLKEIKEHWRECEDKDATRFIVFTHTSKAADLFVDFINKKKQEVGISAVGYHSKMVNDARERAYIKWRMGEHKLLVGTGAIGAGMDYGAVRAVWHRGFAMSNINLIQEQGRAGRDGQRAECILIYCPLTEAECARFVDAESVAEHKKYVEEKGCLRAHLTGFIDGVGVDCLSLPDAVECGNCELMMQSATLSGGTGRMDEGSTEYHGELNQLQYEDMMNERTEILRDVRWIMDELKVTCGVCWFRLQTGRVIKETGGNHMVKDCPFMGKICVSCFFYKHEGREGCKNLRRGLKFQKGCCWSCGFPQYLFSEKVHGDNRSGLCDEKGLEMKLEGVAWWCWRHGDWNGRVQEKFIELKGMSDENWVKWLGQSGMHGMSNLMWVVLFYYRQTKADLDEL